MKKSLAIALVMILVLSCLALAGCGGSGSAPSEDSQYIGTWVSTKAMFQDEEQDINEVLGGATITLTLNADGTAVYNDEEGGESECTWTETSDGFNVKGGDVDMKFKAVDGGVSFTILGVDIIFEQQ